MISVQFFKPNIFREIACSSLIQEENYFQKKIYVIKVILSDNFKLITNYNYSLKTIYKSTSLNKMLD